MEIPFVSANPEEYVDEGVSDGVSFREFLVSFVCFCRYNIVTVKLRG